MRLLNIHTHTFREFHGENIPPYLIASHRWTADETTFKDVLKKRNKSSAGWRKIEGFCEQARKDNELLESFEDVTCCEWLWIDTACIDQKSSSEVSESINSMHAWYSYAQECHAYLADVKPYLASQQSSEVLFEFKNSEWFKRGWTLQELLAPRCVVFFTQTWQVIGHKCADCNSEQSCEGAGPLLNAVIAEVTGIPEEVLQDYERSKAISVEEKMRWQLGRRTTRVEDRAYCLLGLFDVHMPLLYGEGEKAMLRLERTVYEELASPWRSQLRLNFSDSTEQGANFNSQPHSKHSLLRSGRPLAITRYSDVEGEVACICGYTDDDTWLVACDVCQSWQHATCYFPEMDGQQSMAADQEHRCVRCCPRILDGEAAARRQRQKRAQSAQLASSTESGKEFVPSLKRRAEDDGGTGTKKFRSEKRKRLASDHRQAEETQEKETGSSIERVKAKIAAAKSQAYDEDEGGDIVDNAGSAVDPPKGAPSSLEAAGRDEVGQATKEPPIDAAAGIPMEVDGRKEAEAPPLTARLQLQPDGNDKLVGTSEQLSLTLASASQTGLGLADQMSQPETNIDCAPPSSQGETLRPESETPSQGRTGFLSSRVAASQAEMNERESVEDARVLETRQLHKARERVDRGPFQLGAGQVHRGPEPMFQRAESDGDNFGKSGVTAYNSSISAPRSDAGFAEPLSGQIISPQNLFNMDTVPPSTSFTNLTAPGPTFLETAADEDYHTSPLFQDDLGLFDDSSSKQWFALFPEQPTPTPATAATQQADTASGNPTGKRDKPLPPITVDVEDSVALKRARNTAAARKSREKKVEAHEAELASLKAQVEHWKAQALDSVNPEA